MIPLLQDLVLSSVLCDPSQASAPITRSAGVFTRTLPGAAPRWKELADRYAADIAARDQDKVCPQELRALEVLN